MPSAEGTVSDPGRARARPKKGRGVDSAGVMEKRLEDHVAPSGASPVDGAREVGAAMRLLEGRTIPRMPAKSAERGSEDTVWAAAVGWVFVVGKEGRKEGKGNGNAQRVWLSMLYPPTRTVPHTMGPATAPWR